MFTLTTALLMGADLPFYDLFVSNMFVVTSGNLVKFILFVCEMQFKIFVYCCSVWWNADRISLCIFISFID